MLRSKVSYVLLEKGERMLHFGAVNCWINLVGSNLRLDVKCRGEEPEDMCSDFKWEFIWEYYCLHDCNCY